PKGQTPPKPIKKLSFGFSKLIGTIKSELEKAANEAKLKAEQPGDTAEKNIWDELRDDNKEESLEHGFAGDDFEVKNKITVESPGRQAPDITEQTIEPADLSHRNIRSTSEPHAYAVKKRTKQKGLRLSVSKMRKAVILSEILAKPIGLRE
ncbi:MAG: hypothetical protein GY699_22950, partial [Desulfobacteraceae bacterium]|nr:hypothetical protein [Desulfobacteraceae bacterium]